MENFIEKYNYTCNLVLNELKVALNATDVYAVEKLVNDIFGAEKVFCVGVGRVKMSLDAFVKRLTHLGIDAHSVGDITEPALTQKDILIVGSGSGNSIVPVAIAKKAKELNVKKVIHIGSNINGDVSKYSDYIVRIPVQTRFYLPDEIKSEQIMTSLFEQSLLLLTDIIAKIMIDEKCINIKKLWEYHANLE